MKKRIISILISSLFLLSSISCSTNNKMEKTVNLPEVTELKVNDNLPVDELVKKTEFSLNLDKTSEYFLENYFVFGSKDGRKYYTKRYCDERTAMSYSGNESELGYITVNSSKPVPLVNFKPKHKNIFCTNLEIFDNYLVWDEQNEDGIFVKKMNLSTNEVSDGFEKQFFSGQNRVGNELLFYESWKQEHPLKSFNPETNEIKTVAEKTHIINPYEQPLGINNTLGYARLRDDGNAEIIYESKSKSLTIPLKTDLVTDIVTSEKYIIWSQLESKSYWSKGKVFCYDIEDHKLHSVKIDEGRVNATPVGDKYVLLSVIFENSRQVISWNLEENQLSKVKEFSKDETLTSIYYDDGDGDNKAYIEYRDENYIYSLEFSYQ